MSALAMAHGLSTDDRLDRIEALLERTLADREVTELWRDKRQTAEILGISVRLLEDFMADGLPHREIGRKRLFRVSEVEGWLAKRGLLREVHR